MSEIRILTQKQTPSSWILDGRMFRIVSWEIESEEIEELIDSLIGKDSYSINQIRSKEGDLKGITLLFINDPAKVEIIRTTLLVTSGGTELRKTTPLKNNIVDTHTIKTTAPLWITKERILSVFSKFNSDPHTYDLIVDEKELKNVKYPLVRFYRTVVDRKGVKTPVNVIYIEYSPHSKYKYDSFIALSIQHRCSFENYLSKEKAVLIFDKWYTEKSVKESIKDIIKNVREDTLQQEKRKLKI